MIDTEKETDVVKTDTVKIVFRRIIEVIGAEMLISAAAASLIYYGVLDAPILVLITALAATALYIVWTVICLYRFRVVFENKKFFFKINAPIYCIMFAGAIVTGIFKPEPVYTFLFMPFKVLRIAANFCYSQDVWRFPGAGRMTHPVSAVLISLFVALIVIITPLWLSKSRVDYIKEVEQNEDLDQDETE